MSIAQTPDIWRDPAALIREASRLIDDGGSEQQQQQPVAEMIRRAHALVSPDLYVIEHLRRSGVVPDYLDLFGERVYEKIAALIFLARQKLFDIEGSTDLSLDIQGARQDLANYVEILFHLRAIDALIIFYKIASSQHKSKLPALWATVQARSLYLMALLTECRPTIFTFLDRDNSALIRLEELTNSSRPEIAQAMRQLSAEYREYKVQDPTPRPVPIAPYVPLYDQYQQMMPELENGGGGSATGMSSLLTAEDRIDEALRENDYANLVKWLSEGSHAAIRKLFNRARTVMATDEYIALLELALKQPDIDPVRTTATVLELGRVNRSSQMRGGMPRINKTIMQLAMPKDEMRTGVALVAVDELSAVAAVPELYMVVEQAPIVVVAEATIRSLKDLRKLNVMDSILAVRPYLRPTFLAAKQEINQYQSLMDAALSCPTTELSRVYMDRLRLMNAVPELEQIARGRTPSGIIAQEMLDELRSEMPQLPSKR